MPSNSKWLEDVRPEQPVSEAARIAIATRSATMVQCLSQAAKGWKEDNEYVHHLRTASRRTQAALELYALLLPLKRSARVQKATKKLRKAGGNARDLDVFLQRIQKKSDPALSSNEQEEVTRFLRGLRKQAQPKLEKAFVWAEKEKLAKQFDELCQRIRWREAVDEESLAAMAPTLLEPLVVRFFHFSQQLTDAPESLHQLRIEGKNTRYAMELVEGGFPTDFREELYQAFEKVQSKLGKINDHHTAIENLRKWQRKTAERKFPRFLAVLIEDEQRQLDEKSQAFHVWWTDQRVLELKQHFQHYLGNGTLS